MICPLFVDDPMTYASDFPMLPRDIKPQTAFLFQEDEEIKVGRAWHSQLPRSLQKNMEMFWPENTNYKLV